MKHYATRRPWELDAAGGYYCRHVAAMTEEGLHSKADIAAELAHRDNRIDELTERIRQLEAKESELSKILKASISRLEVIDHTSDGEGRVYVKRYDGRFRINLGLQDSDRTVKVFLE